MRAGEIVEDFALPDQNGESRKLSSLLKGGPLVLFFYPAAMTYGCTKQSCRFRDLAPEFEKLGVQRVGISADPVKKQKEFSDLHAFDFLLLSDADFSVSEQLGVRRVLLKDWNRRMTFLIDTDRTLIRVIHNEISMEAHAEKALKIFQVRQALTQS